MPPLVETLVSFSFGNEHRGLGGVNEAERISAAERAQRRAADRAARSSQLANQQPQRHGVNEPRCSPHCYPVHTGLHVIFLFRTRFLCLNVWKEQRFLCGRILFSTRDKLHLPLPFVI